MKILIMKRSEMSPLNPKCLSFGHERFKLKHLCLKDGAKYKCLTPRWNEMFTVGSVYTAEMRGKKVVLTNDDGQIVSKGNSFFVKIS
jgi:CRISPR/Cas system CSM-associated protein Csm4 (group 5 of RAMP superfamily)